MNTDLIFLLNTYTIILYSLECFNLISQFKINFVLKLVPHTVKRCFLILSWTDFIWFERLYSSPNSALQSEHWYGFFFLWTVEMCCNNFCFVGNDISCLIKVIEIEDEVLKSKHWIIFMKKKGLISIAKS